MTAIIGYENLLEDGTVSATTEAAGFEKENAYDHHTADAWKPTAVAAILSLDAGKRPKGMWLASTTAETVGVDETTELVDNTAFGTSSNWTLDSDWSITGGELVGTMTAAGTAANATSDTFTLVSGANYVLTFDITAKSGLTGNEARFLIDGNLIDIGDLSVANGHTYDFVASGTTASIQFKLTSTADNTDTITVDNVSVKRTGNLIVNGELNTNADEWALDSDWAYSSTKLVGTMTAAGTAASALQIITCVSGETYTLSYEISSISGLSGDELRLSVTGESTVDIGSYSNGFHAFTFTASTTSITISFILSTTADNTDTVTLDNINCRLATPDLSAENNGGQIFGSIDFTPVNSGSDLMAASGYGTNDYIQFPSDSSLNYSTNDFFFAGWSKDLTTSNKQAWINRTDLSGATYGSTPIVFRLTSNGDIQTILGATTNVTVGSYNTAVWKMYTMYRSGTTVYIYVNDVLVDSFTASDDLDDADAKLYLGALGYNGVITSEVGGSLALWRTGAYAPTALEIKSWYNTEKCFFEANASAPSNYLASWLPTADYFAIAAHDGYTNSSTFELEWSDDNSSWTSLGSITPNSDGPQLLTFTSTSHDYWRVTMDGSISSLGHVSFGRRLELPLSQGSGYQPLDESRRSKRTVTISESGHTLGSTIERVGGGGSIQIRNMTDKWRRTNWPELADHLDDGKLFFFCNDIENYSEEVTLCWLDGQVPTPSYDNPLRLSASIQVKSRK